MTSPVRGGLYPVQIGVVPFPGHQLFVRADLDEPCPLEHYDEIRHAHRGEPVRDQDRDPTIAPRTEVARGRSVALGSGSQDVALHDHVVKSPVLAVP